MQGVVSVLRLKSRAKVFTTSNTNLGFENMTIITTYDPTLFEGAAWYYARYRPQYPPIYLIC
jgi:hypothetical protein